MTVKLQGNCVVFDDGQTQTAFPKGTLVFQANKPGTAIAVKTRGSRKTVLTVNIKDLGKSSIEEAMAYLGGLAY